MPARGSANNLEVTLRDWLRRFRPGSGGLDRVLDDHQMVMPLPEWSRWADYRNGVTASITAGSTTRITLATVPDDQRWWLTLLFVLTTTGDNLPGQLGLTGPAGYGGGAVVISYNEAGTRAYTGWPRSQGGVGGTNVDISFGQPPLLLEPGTLITVDPTGAGVAASVFTWRLGTLRSKLVRTLAP